eukprot:916004-Pyramimonas_sp.AAC.1
MRLLGLLARGRCAAQRRPSTARTRWTNRSWTRCAMTSTAFRRQSLGRCTAWARTASTARPRWTS